MASRTDLVLRIGRRKGGLEFLLFFEQRGVAGVKLQHFVHESKCRLVVS